MDFVLGFMTAAWVLTLAGVSYSLWRYSVLPTRALETEVRLLIDTATLKLMKEIGETRVALKGTNEALVNLDNKVGLVQSLSRSDEEQAELERRWRARQNTVSAGGFGRAISG